MWPTQPVRAKLAGYLFHKQNKREKCAKSMQMSVSYAHKHASDANDPFATHQMIPPIW